MRVIASLLTLIFLTAALWLGQRLWQQMSQPEAAVSLAAVQTSLPVEREDLTTSTRVWPPLFGTPVVVEPQPPQVVSEPQPPAVPQPPIESLGYRLQGVVRNGTANWAIVTHPTGDVILHVGDPLGDAGLRVVAIEAEGLWLLRDGERVLLGFETQLP